jgi:hypothetical protein
VPKLAETSQEGKVTILWNQQVQTDRTIRNNKPDILLRDHKNGAYMLIDVANSKTKMRQRKKLRRLKHKDLTPHLQNT